jgi:hypothetical protein
MREWIKRMLKYYTNYLKNLGSKTDLTPQEKLTRDRATIFLTRWSDPRNVDEAVDEARDIGFPTPKKKNKVVTRPPMVNRPHCPIGCNSSAEAMRKWIKRMLKYYTNYLKNLGSKTDLTPEEKLTRGRARMFLTRWSDPRKVDEALDIKFPTHKKKKKKKVVTRPPYDHSTLVGQEVSSLPEVIVSALARPNLGESPKQIPSMVNRPVHPIDYNRLGQNCRPLYRKFVVPKQLPVVAECLDEYDC